MKTVRIIARAVIYDKDGRRLLLARNKEEKFWYPPGGGWDAERETILECAVREVYEESGLRVELQRLLYAQEFHISESTTVLEFFWLARPTEKNDIQMHRDLDPKGHVEEVRWFSRAELGGFKIFPPDLKDRFWEEIEYLEKTADPFLGVVKKAGITP